MKDFVIRRCLKVMLEEQFSDDPSIIVSEFGLCQGLARADLVVVNGELHGYEIKSEADTLARLPAQIAAYSRVLDFITIVTGKKHLAQIKKMVPKYWGIMLVHPAGEDIVSISYERAARRNPDVDRYALAQLLWREEVLSILTERGLAKGLKGKARPILWRVLATALDTRDLNTCVRDSIKLRESWRADAIRTQCGVTGQLVSR